MLTLAKDWDWVRQADGLLSAQNPLSSQYRAFACVTNFSAEEPS